MDDKHIHAHIEELVAEEHRLLEYGDRGTMLPDDRARLEAVEVQLDRYWDLLRQRRRAATRGKTRTSRTCARPTRSNTTSSSGRREVPGGRPAQLRLVPSWDDGEIGRHSRLCPGAGGRETAAGMRSNSANSLHDRMKRRAKPPLVQTSGRCRDWTGAAYRRIVRHGQGTVRTTNSRIGGGESHSGTKICGPQRHPGSSPGHPTSIAYGTAAPTPGKRSARCLRKKRAFVSARLSPGGEQNAWRRVAFLGWAAVECRYVSPHPLLRLRRFPLGRQGIDDGSLSRT